MSYDTWKTRAPEDESPEFNWQCSICGGHEDSCECWDEQELCTKCGQVLILGEIMGGVCDQCARAQTEIEREVELIKEGRALGRLWDDIQRAAPLVDLDHRLQSLELRVRRLEER